MLICIVYDQGGRTAFDLAMGNGHMSTAGCFVLATKKVEDVTVEVCDSLCVERMK